MGALPPLSELVEQELDRLRYQSEHSDVLTLEIPGMASYRIRRIAKPADAGSHKEVEPTSSQMGRSEPVDEEAEQVDRLQAEALARIQANRDRAEQQKRAAAQASAAYRSGSRKRKRRLDDGSPK